MTEVPEGHEIKMTISPFMLPKGSGANGGVAEDIYIKRAGNKVGDPRPPLPLLSAPSLPPCPCILPFPSLLPPALALALAPLAFAPCPSPLPLAPTNTHIHTPLTS